MNVKAKKPNRSGTPPAAPGPDPVDEQRRLDAIRKAINEKLYDIALRSSEHWIQRNPGQSVAHLMRGICLTRMGNFPAALAPLQEAHRLAPKEPETLRHLLRVTHQLGQTADEARYLRDLLVLRPDETPVARRLFNIQDAQADHAGLLDTADRFLAGLKDANIGIVCVKSLKAIGQTEKANAKLEALLADPATSDGAAEAWTLFLDTEQDYLDAAARVEGWIASGRESAALWAALGRLYGRLDRVSDSMRALKRALELDPSRNGTWHDLGVLQRQIGEIEESQQSMLRCLELDPFHASALRVAGAEHKCSYGDNLWVKINHALARVHDYPEAARPQVYYAAAKACEDVGETAAGFDHYARGGQIQKKLAPWNESRMRNVLAVMRRFLTAKDFADAATQGHPSPKPVFVVGMPRSGTTLLEQVIASHPLAFGAGELKLAAGVINNIEVGRVKIETFHDGNVKAPRIDTTGMTIRDRGARYLSTVEKLAGPKAQRIVDKMPGNYHWLGPLAVILPDCHLIHSRRHPVETCLSMYRIFFPDGIPFSYDLRDLGKAYKMYLDYMAFWREMLPPGRMLEVRYEDMVYDLETQARRIIDYIGLPWNDACLRFYETERAVKTASVTQVRKPIYTSSTNRWRKYEPYLKPLLDELGPLVQEYEDEVARAQRQTSEAVALSAQ